MILTLEDRTLLSFAAQLNLSAGQNSEAIVAADLSQVHARCYSFPSERETEATKQRMKKVPAVCFPKETIT
jgi:hypothetical protein